MPSLRKLIGNRFSHVAFAFCVLGGWAIWANRMHPMPAPLIAGLVQGLISATITVALQWVIARAHALTGSLPLSIAAGAATSLSILLAIHWLARTPELIATIAIPWMVGVVYITLFASALHRKAAQ